MSNVGTGIFAKGRAVPEDVVALSVFTFPCFGCFVLQGVVVSTFIECLLVRRKEVLLDQRMLYQMIGMLAEFGGVSVFGVAE